MFELAITWSPDLVHLLLLLLTSTALVVAKVTRDKHAGISAVAVAVGEVLGVHPDGQAILQDVMGLLEDRGHSGHAGTLVKAFEGDSQDGGSRPGGPHPLTG